jgi:hypothetical protein
LITKLAFANPEDDYAFLWVFIALAVISSLALVCSFFSKNEKLIPFSPKVFAQNLMVEVKIVM